MYSGQAGSLSDRMEFGLLGPLTVVRNGVAVQITSGKQRAALAALLIKANHVVTVDDLIEALWADPPRAARVTVQNYVKRLRQVLAVTDGCRIMTRPAGYLISAAAGELDVVAFTVCCGAGYAAAAAGDWARASQQWTAALAWWRGNAFADVPSDALVRNEGGRLEEMRWQALEARLGADLRLGRNADVIADARQLIAADALREHVHEALILALHRAGQRAAALAAYQNVRRYLIAEIGIEPGARLRSLQSQILANAPGLDLPLRTVPVAGGSWVPLALGSPVPGAGGDQEPPAGGRRSQAYAS